MRTRSLLLAPILFAGLAASALGQFQDAAPRAPAASEAAVERWRFGVIVKAGSGPCRGIVATTSVPTDWPEQQVRIVDEQISPGVRVSYAMIDDAGGQPAVKQMTARIASLAPGEEAQAVVTFEIKRGPQPAPADTDAYVLPDAKRPDRKLRSYLRPSPYIESSDAQIRAVAEKLAAGEPTAWGRVAAIHDWVRRTIELVDNRGGQVKTTLQTLRDGTGDCDELTSLFVAVCRAGGIPARTVRVPGHCYPEFYLEDAQGKGHWIPCDATRNEPFGGVSKDRPVLQKGDNLRLRDPATRRTRSYRFLPDNLTMADQRGTPPQVRVVLERVAED